VRRTETGSRVSRALGVEWPMAETTDLSAWSSMKAQVLGCFLSEPVCQTEPWSKHCFLSESVRPSGRPPNRGVQIARDLKDQYGPKLKDFREALAKEVCACLALSPHCVMVALREGVSMNALRPNPHQSGSECPVAVSNRANCVPLRSMGCNAAAPAAVGEQVPAPIAALKHEVEDFAKQFPTIGFEKSSMRYVD
jgi:hypothetical protein